MLTINIVKDKLCSCCSKKILQKVILSCQLCNTSYHKKCVNFSKREYINCSKQKSRFVCNFCLESFPFFSLSDIDFKVVNFGLNYDFTIDTTPFPSLSEQKFFESCNNINVPLDNEDHPVSINSRYYDIDEFSKLDFKENDFGILHLNIASLNKHMNDLQNFLSFFDYKFDIIGLSEHKISFNSPSNYNLKGYNFCYNPTTSTHGGTGFFISNKLSYIKRDELSIFCAGQLESTFIEIKQDKGKNIMCGCIYRHPNMSLNDFNENYLTPLLNKIGKEKKNCILMGDFNVNLLDYGKKATVSNFQDLLSSYMFTPFILQPTRITESSQTLIDNIFLNTLEYDSISGNITSKISDHLLQFLILKSKKFLKVSSNYHNVYHRDYTFFNKDEFEKDLQGIRWNEIMDSGDASASFDYFLSNLNKLLDEHAPLKKLSRREFSFKSKPWISKDIQKLMIKRDRIYKLYCKEKRNNKKAKLHQDFSSIRNLVVHKIRNSKEKYCLNFFNNNMSNIKKTWDGIKMLITLKTKCTESPKLIMNDNKHVSNPYDIASIFNDFFVNIGPSIANKIPYSKFNYKNFLPARSIDSVYLYPTNEEEISKIIAKFDTNKSTGPSSIPLKILKEFSHILSKPISSLINASMIEGVFPSALKIANVVPVFKKGDSTLCTNYRPISLLSIFSKLYEKCMYKRLYTFLEKKQLIYEKQFGFRQGYSTNHALISLIETIKNYVDNDNFVCGIFIDLQKAFDTVNHEILLDKLLYYGVRGEANKWIKSFLSERKQQVIINGINSSSQTTSCGVPQGSTLGPLLFLIYINDLHQVFKKCIVHHFADDTNLIFPSKKIGTIESVVNYELKMLVEWLKANKLSLNESKTEMIIFHSPFKQVPSNFSIKINNFKLVKQQNVGYLGVRIDEVLSWNKQIDIISTKLCNVNAIISKLRYFAPIKVLLSLYYSLFYSCILYGCLVWQFSSQTNLNRLIKLQKKCLRLLTFSPYDAHTNPLFSNLKILKIEDIFKYQTLKLLHEYSSSKLPQALMKLFKPVKDTHQRETRSNTKNLLYVPSINTVRFGVNSISYNGPKLWNDHIKSCKELLTVKTPDSLKKYLKSFFLQSYLSNH